MNKLHLTYILLIVVLLFSCKPKSNKNESILKHATTESLIVDCHYTFDQAIVGSNAPKSVINQLELIEVKYYSTDNKIHSGQILTNKAIAEDIKAIFELILKDHFPIAHAIPIVKYGWDDNLSMNDNNTYSFCYRDVNFSMHARGLAIDINPYFNPVIWKAGYNRTDKPIGAVYNPKVKGAFTTDNDIVLAFKKHRFHWGGTFTAKCDYHHFEKAGYYKPKEAVMDSTVQDSLQ